MIDLLIALALGCFYFISVLACGFYFIRNFSFLGENIIVRYGFSLTCGLGVLGFLWSILVSIPHAMQSLSVFVLLCALIALGRKYLIGAFVDAKRILLNIKLIISPAERSLRWLIFPLLLYILMAIPLALHPLGTDALAFYFAQAKLIAYANHFVPLSGYESFAQIPLPAELNYSALILMGSEWAARFVTTFEFWACTLLVAGCVYEFNNKNIRRVWLSVFLLLTSSGVTLLVSDGKTDLYGAMLGFAACYLSLVIPLNVRRNVLFLGVIVGFSFTAKLSYVPVLVPMIGLMIFARLWRDNGFKKAVMQSFAIGSIIGICIIVTFIPNAAKNYMAYGEPLAPFMLLHPGNYTPFLDQSWFSSEITRYILSIYPFVWTFGQFPMQHGNLSPYVWAALPILFFIQWKKVSLAMLIDNKSVLFALAGALGMVAWAIFYPSVVAPRYVFPALLAFIPIATVGLDKFWDMVCINRYAHIVFVGILFCASFMVVANNLSPMKRAAQNILIGPQRTNLRDIHFAAKSAEDDMRPQGRLFLAAWERALLKPQTISCMLNNNEQKALGQIKNSSKYWQTLYSFGTGVVLINVTARKDVMGILNPEEKPSWLEIKKKKLNDNYIMYVIVPNSNAPPPNWACLKTSKNYYQPVELE